MSRWRWWVVGSGLVGGTCVWANSLDDRRFVLDRYVTTWRRTNRIVHAFECGGTKFGNYRPVETRGDTIIPFLPREALIARVHQYVYPDEHDRFYGVITGPSGAGKSVAVREAIRQHEAPVSIKEWSLANLLWRPKGPTVKDTVYVQFKNLCASAPQEVINECMWRLAYAIGATTVPSRRSAIFEWILDGAAAYHRKYGRTPTIVLDGMEHIATRSPDFVKALQGFAKDCADGSLGPLRVIFVTNEAAGPEGSTLKMLRASDSAWARSHSPLEIGDVSREEARQLIRSYMNELDEPNMVSDSEIEEAIDRFAGGRIQLLRYYAVDRSPTHSLNDIIHKFNAHTKYILSNKVVMNPDHALFTELLAKGKVDFATAWKLLPHEDIDELVRQEILSEQELGTVYALHSQRIKTFLTEPRD